MRNKHNRTQKISEKMQPDTIKPSDGDIIVEFYLKYYNRAYRQVSLYICAQFSKKKIFKKKIKNIKGIKKEKKLHLRRISVLYLKRRIMILPTITYVHIGNSEHSYSLLILLR